MRNFLTLLRRELSSVFLSPVAYVTMALFTSAASWTFLATVNAQAGQSVYPEQLLFVSILIWMPFLITVISMRLFAEEKRSGTIETLMTTAIEETTVVLAKYIGALLFGWITIVPSIGALFALVAISPGIASVDFYALIGGCTILALVSIACTAIGVLVSLLTRNQIVAAICCFWAIFSPFMVQPFMRAVPLFRHATIERFSLERHVTLFVSGTISLQPAILYLSIAVLMLFTAVRVLESRRWL
jgi:ABC-2 type transport system permease protein